MIVGCYIGSVAVRSDGPPKQVSEREKISELLNFGHTDMKNIHVSLIFTRYFGIWSMPIGINSTDSNDASYVAVR